jgi:hypothetical protein
MVPPPRTQTAPRLVASRLTEASGKCRGEQMLGIVAGNERAGDPVYHGIVLRLVMT